ncbi:MAG: hypothetical protein JJE49_03845 [Peptostreptococcaceae bacterium]|nr:hypothetical protein [Peptostreptococcaceae bacterium]
MKDNGKFKNRLRLARVVDERTRNVVNQGDAYTGRFMLFAVLLDVVFRGFMSSTPFIAENWDLMAIVIIGGFISTAYQIKSKVLFNRPFAPGFIFILSLMAGCAAIAFVAMRVVLK